MRFLAKASLIVGAIFLRVEMASASVTPNNVGFPGEVIFILNGPQNPADVRMVVKKYSAQKFMRLPDLGAISQDSGKKPLFTGAASSTIHREVSTEATKDPTLATNDEKRIFKFKPTKVSGKTKLPSIKFSSLSPSLELYEEAASLDFTDKSLKDGGF